MNVKDLAFIHQVLLEERARRSQAWNAAKRDLEEKTRAAESRFACTGFADLGVTGSVEKAQEKVTELHEKFLQSAGVLERFELQEWN